LFCPCRFGNGKIGRVLAGDEVLYLYECGENSMDLYVVLCLLSLEISSVGALLYLLEEVCVGGLPSAISSVAGIVTGFLINK
jgi:hypothetical protein